MPYSKFTFNLAGAQKRYETLNGRQYLVLPAVMATPGVISGSDGPLYYPPEELAKNLHTWNHRPAVLYHPEIKDGQTGSACTPAVVEQQGVGTLYNSSYDGRLKVEAWVDEDKFRRLDPKTMERIDNNEMIEVSTGLFHDREARAGEYNGKAYTGVVRNIQGDHLAILPDQKGACSIADGAGLLRNADGSDLSFDDIKDQIRKLLRPDKDTGVPAICDSYCYVADLYPKYAIYEADAGCCYKIGYKVRSGKVTLDGEPEEVRKVTSYVTANGQSGSISTRAYVTMNGNVIGNEDMQGPIKTIAKPRIGEVSDPMRKQQFQKALQDKFSGIQQEGSWGGWVTDLVANYVVWSKDNKLFRLPYTYDDDKIRFDGEPEEVERTSEYRAKQNTPIDGTSSPYSVNQGTNMATKQQIDTIVRLAELAKANKLTDNAIHQGAHQLIHDATQHSDPHHAPGGASDSQLRTAAGGARKEQVDKMISGGGGWGEEDRKFLMDLPDDGFERVAKFVSRGATQPIVPYSYEGVGDRSNAHAQNQQRQQPMTEEQATQAYIAQAPPSVREALTNAMVAAQAEKEILINAITSSPTNRFNPEWLRKQTPATLQGMAALAGGVRQQNNGQPVHNYSGQGEVAMFLPPPEPTQNQAGDDSDVLPTPTMNFERRKDAS